MKTVEITNRKQTIKELNIPDIMGELRLTCNESEVRVTINQGYIDIEPNPSSCVWNVSSFKKYKKEISDSINKALGVNAERGLILIGESWQAGGEGKEVWYYDEKGNNLFYIDSKGKLHYHTAKENPSYEFRLEDAKDRLHIDRAFIDSNYKLSEKDLEAIENTDIEPEELRKAIIQFYKGQYATSSTAKNAIRRIGSYNYKFFFKCERCGKESYHWRYHHDSVLIDYWGPYYCEECQEIVDKENEEKRKVEEANHKYRMEHDPEYRKQQEALEAAMPKFQRLTPRVISTDLCNEVPMEPPKDNLYFMRCVYKKD